MKCEQYTKRPVVIEAIQCRYPNNKQDVLEFCPTAMENDGGDSGLEWFIIPTLEGEHIAKEGDFIIKGVKGEFYPCKPDVFALTYYKSTAIELVRVSDFKPKETPDEQ